MRHLHQEAGYGNHGVAVLRGQGLHASPVHELEGVGVGLDDLHLKEKILDGEIEGLGPGRLRRVLLAVRPDVEPVGASQSEDVTVRVLSAPLDCDQLFMTSHGRVGGREKGFGQRRTKTSQRGDGRAGRKQKEKKKKSAHILGFADETPERSRNWPVRHERGPNRISTG